MVKAGKAQDIDRWVERHVYYLQVSCFVTSSQRSDILSMGEQRGYIFIKGLPLSSNSVKVDDKSIQKDQLSRVTSF